MNIFNAALVTPTYYVFFTSSTIVASAILFQGFKGSVTSIITVVLGFLQICAGVVLLQLSKSAKDVPDAAVFKGDLNQVRTVAEQEEPESEPKADAIRGTAGILRTMSQARKKNEMAEAKRVHEDRMKDQMEPIGEDTQVEWDGLRRRKTTISSQGSLERRKTLHPPLGMSAFPDADEIEDVRPDTGGSGGFNGGFMHSFRRNASSRFSRQNKSLSTGTPPLPQPPRDETPPTDQVLTAMEMDHVYGLPPSLRHTGGDGALDTPGHLGSSTEYTGAGGRPVTWAESVESRPSSSRHSLAPTPPPHSAKRQFSFQNPFHRHKPDTPTTYDTTHYRPSSRLGIGSRGSSKEHAIPNIKSATEEERLGLVKGDSKNTLASPDFSEEPESNEPSDEDDWQLEGRPAGGGGTAGQGGRVPFIREEEKESESGSSTPSAGLPGYAARREKDWEDRPPPGGGAGRRAGAFI